MPRGITRVRDSGYETETGDTLSPWMRHVMNQFVEKQETAADLARKRQSIVQEINHIKATKPRYATVDDAVNDMKNRTGLNAYLTKIQKDQQEKFRTIVAQINEADVVPESLKKYDVDSIITYVRNSIDNVHGLSVTIPQLQYDIEHLFKVNPADVRNREVEQFLSNMILEARSTIPHEFNSPYIGKGVGKEDAVDDQAFSLLQPASK